jgi:hypothetical protein
MKRSLLASALSLALTFNSAFAATANLTDMSILTTDTVLGNRVLISYVNYCDNVILNESITAATLAVHIARKNYCQQILNNPSNFKAQFVDAVSANQTVANDATAAGTLVGMTPTQVATAASACTDTDINNAVAAAFNAFIQGI